MKEFKSLKLSDGRKLAYMRCGSRNGRPLLYCHGGISSKLDIAFADAFCEKENISIIAPDRPGIGDSDRKAGRSLLDWAQDARQLLDDLQIEQSAVLGWSLGAPYALAMAYATPERVRHVGTIGGVGEFSDRKDVDELGLLIDRLLLTCPVAYHPILSALLNLGSILPKPMMHKALLDNLKSQSDREIVGKMKADDATSFLFDCIKNGSRGVVEDYAAVGRKWGFTPDQIGVRATLWHGEQDDMCPHHAGLKLASSMKNAEFKLVQSAGHFLLHKHTADVLKHLVD